MKKIISRFPLISFVLALVMIFVILFLTKGADEVVIEEKEEKSKSVQVYGSAGDRYTTVIAEVDRADTVLLTATTSGIVSQVTWEGARIGSGGQVARLADTYGGTSVAASTAALAAREAQYQGQIIDDTLENLDDQKDDINKTGDLESKITKRQISIQKRAAEFAYDRANLALSQAQAQVALERVVAPFYGEVQTVFVSRGDRVSAGDPIAIIKSTKSEDAQIVAYVSADRAAYLNPDKTALVSIAGKDVEVSIVHIASAATDAGSYAVTFALDADIASQIADGAFVEVQVPLVQDDGLIIPLDAVRYSNDRAEVYIVTGPEDAPEASFKEVLLGSIIGTYVVITDGLSADDVVILDRWVSEGDMITIAQ